jgi:hypothetical protein
MRGKEPLGLFVLQSDAERAVVRVWGGDGSVLEVA